MFALVSLLMVVSCGDDDMVDMNTDPDGMDTTMVDTTMMDTTTMDTTMMDTTMTGMLFDCSTGLYKDDLFSEIEKVTVKYGENIAGDGSGNLQELFMDIYTPQNDLNENRAMIIFAYGGSFVAGSKEQMEPFCRQFAAKGFVTAAIDYRLLNPLDAFSIDSIKGLNIAVKAMHDMKASIRHMRKEAANGNPYGIDVDKIYAAGVSAGAITALNAGIVDDEDALNLEPHIQEIFDANDGVEGASGDAENLSYSSKVAGIINMSGAIYRLDWYDATDPPVASIHGTADGTVPYNFGWVSVNVIQVIKLFGSGDIHPYLETIGVPNVLQTIDEGGHTDIYTASEYMDQRNDYYNNMIYDLFVDNLCN